MRVFLFCFSGLLGGKCRCLVPVPCLVGSNVHLGGTKGATWCPFHPVVSVIRLRFRPASDVMDLLVYVTMFFFCLAALGRPAVSVYSADNGCESYVAVAWQVARWSKSNCLTWVYQAPTLCIYRLFGLTVTCLLEGTKPC